MTTMWEKADTVAVPLWVIFRGFGRADPAPTVVVMGEHVGLPHGVAGE